MAENKEVLDRVLESGEDTSEGQAIAAGTQMGNTLTIIGTMTAAFATLGDTLNLLPDVVKNSKVGAIGIIIIGAVLGVLGVAKTTMLKIAYAKSRAQVKAAAAAAVTTNRKPTEPGV